MPNVTVVHFGRSSQRDIGMTDKSAEFAIHLARTAGNLIRTAFTKGGVAKIWKSDNTPLTETDLAIHRLVVSSVRNEFPEHSVLSEENDDTERHIVPNAEYVWVCDPIDGTLPFSHGLPTSTFSLALTHQGDVILGVVYDPFLERLFTARKGGGAFLNGDPISVSALRELKTAVIDLEGLPNECDGVIYHTLRDRRVGAKVTTLHSLVYGGCLVASGNFTGVVFGKEKPWDVAAIKVLIEEAGGYTTDFYGQQQRYDQAINGFIGTNRAIHDKLLAVLSECRKPSV